MDRDVLTWADLFLSGFRWHRKWTKDSWIKALYLREFTVWVRASEFKPRRFNPTHILAIEEWH